MRIITKRDTLSESAVAKKSLTKKLGLSQIIGKSCIIQELHEKITLISSCNVPVLITGESGTGKELVARAIHYLCPQAGKPFVPVNCGAIPENLFENELFGHVKGAFTGASLRQNGLVKEAEGGTLFLDEIGAISLYAQVKLLRLLQEREYKPLGISKPCRADIRIIAATNRDLKGLIKSGIFRDDIFYRLNIISLRIPPLRERKEDIPVLVEYFLKKYSREYNKPIRVVSADTMKVFISYPWPGNIRELENKIQQIVVMSVSSVMYAKDIQLPINEPTFEEPILEELKVAKQKAIDSFEKTYLIRLLTEQSGNVVSAAKRAGKCRTALWNLIKKHNLSPKEFHPYHRLEEKNLD